MFQVRDLEFQLAEERKTRIKQETRALATASSSSSTTTSRQLPTITEKKPPLAPPRSMRMPLRRITNFMPQPGQPSQGHTKRFSDATSKENNNNSLRRSSSMDINTLMKPRRSSIAFRPAPPPSAIASGNNKTLQPRRRVSIATLRPEPSSSSYMNMATPSRPTFRGGGGDPRRGRYSKLFSPDHNLVTPNAMKGSRFKKSPLGGGGPRHPTVVALQKKAVVWSPLKFKNRRPSFIAMRASSSSATDLVRREQ